MASISLTLRSGVALSRADMRSPEERAEIEKLSKEMENVVKSDPQIVAKVNKLCTIPGCAITTVAAIVAETNGFKEFFF